MGNWSLTGILLTVGVFLAVFGFILTQIHISNPISQNSTAANWVWNEIFSWILH